MDEIDTYLMGTPLRKWDVVMCIHSIIHFSIPLYVNHQREGKLSLRVCIRSYFNQGPPSILLRNYVHFSKSSSELTSSDSEKLPITDTTTQVYGP